MMDAEKFRDILDAAIYRELAEWRIWEDHPAKYTARGEFVDHVWSYLEYHLPEGILTEGDE